MNFDLSLFNIHAEHSIALSISSEKIPAFIYLIKSYVFTILSSKNSLRHWISWINLIFSHFPSLIFVFLFPGFWEVFSTLCLTFNTLIFHPVIILLISKSLFFFFCNLLISLFSKPSVFVSWLQETLISLGKVMSFFFFFEVSLGLYPLSSYFSICLFWSLPSISETFLKGQGINGCPHLRLRN